VGEVAVRNDMETELLSKGISLGGSWSNMRWNKRSAGGERGTLGILKREVGSLSEYGRVVEKADEAHKAILEFKGGTAEGNLGNAGTKAMGRIALSSENIGPVT